MSELSSFLANEAFSAYFLHVCLGCSSFSNTCLPCFAGKKLCVHHLHLNNCNSVVLGLVILRDLVILGYLVILRDLVVLRYLVVLGYLVILRDLESERC